MALCLGESERSYYRARYYDPKTGRFLTEDPVRFMASANFYPYVENSPLSWKDASGLLPLGGIATLEPSSILPGRLKLEGDLDPLCRKGRNIAKDEMDLEISLSTRRDEIDWYANHPNPSMKALAADPGHLLRIDNEEITLERCKDNCPEKKPAPRDIPIPVVPENDWKKWLARNRTPLLVGGAVVAGAVAIVLAPETGGGSLLVFATAP